MGTQPRAALIACCALAACGPSSGGDDAVGDDAPGDPDGGGDPGDRPDGEPFADCNALPLTLRDFSPTTHPDFEPALDSDFAFPGIVEDELGPDGKPVYAHPGATLHTAGPDEFAQWYRDTPSINQTFESTIPLTLSPSGSRVFDSAAFFPLDGLGFGEEGQPHNFHFTTEVHTRFDYGGGEVFTFSGDDDLWLFINGRLAIDLGGLHPELSETVDLDARAAELGIEVGERYEMDIFHAERHTDASNFHVETTIDCFVVE